MSQAIAKAETLDEKLQALGEMIKEIRFAMLTTRSSEGRLHSRPMATREMDENGILWFYTGKSSLKVREIEAVHEVNLSYQDPGKNLFVSVAGMAVLSVDPEKIRELWSPMLKAWFPQGLDDPELALLRVEVAEAEYWDVKSGKMTSLWGLAKSVLGQGSGADLQNDPRIHGIIRTESAQTPGLPL